MTELIAEALAEYIADVPFADKVVGLVKELSYREGDSSGTGPTPLLKYPVYYKKTEAECRRAGYTDLVPDSRKKSIMYVENYGTRVGERHGDKLKFTTTVRVVGWGNKGMSPLAPAYVIAAVPETPNIPGLIGIRFTPTQVLGVDEKIFSRYTYKEEELQFLLHPYTAFAIVYEVTYSLKLDCLPELV